MEGPVLVSIKCTVYNHEPYLRDCLNGFVMQKTNFRFEAIVHDDASTDGSADIIREYAEKYPEIIKPIYETENQYSKHDGSLSRIMDDACTGKYIAICEGDDFWTDSLKLQKQYDIMETNPECTICFNRVQAVQKDGKTKAFVIPSTICAFKEGKVSIIDMITEELDRQSWCFHTSSFFGRRDIMIGVHDFQKEYLPSFPYGDMPTIMYALLSGAGYFLSEIMGCYRLFSGGWNSTMRENPSLQKEMNWRVLRGYQEFDKYTKYRYHKSVRRYTRNIEYYWINYGKTYQLKFLDFNIMKLRRKIRSVVSDYRHKAKSFFLKFRGKNGKAF